MTIDKKKLGFDGQWVDGTPVGQHIDSDGDPIKLDIAFLEAVARNYDPTLHAAPATIGHPKTDAPAYAWVAELRVNNGRLERRFSEVNPEFEEIVRKGQFKKRSDSFYLDPKEAPGGRAPYLRHVGFLGAQPPAIKGIRDIHFSEDDKTVTVDIDSSTIEFSEGATMTDAEKKAADEQTKKTIVESVREFFREQFSGKEKETASFGEADAQRLIEGAVTKVKTSFEEKVTKLEDENKKLREAVDTQGGSSKRAAILSFCESNPTKVLPALKAANIVGFMETLDDTPVKKKITVISFAEKDGAEVKTDLSQLEWFQKHIEALPSFVQFGESFGSLKVTGDGSEIVDPKRMGAMREAAGIKKDSKAAAA